MKNMNFKNIIICIFSLTIFIFPVFTYAMSISVEKNSKEIKVDDVVVINVFLNSDGQEINAIDGKIEIYGNYEIKALYTAGSVFDLWPNKPSFKKKEISFVGGSTAGVFGSKLKVFSVVLKPLDTNKINFYSDDVNVFLNDGLGTKKITEELNKDITVSEKKGESLNELEKIILEDKNLPEDFEVLVGRDNNLFDGKYFASFNTVDNESGLNRYEIIENNNSPVRTGNTYVLQDQDLKGELTVKAIDNSGNVRTVTVDIENALSEKYGINWFVIFSFVVLLIVIKIVIKFFYKRNEYKKI